MRAEHTLVHREGLERDRYNQIALALHLALLPLSHSVVRLHRSLEQGIGQLAIAWRVLRQCDRFAAGNASGRTIPKESFSGVFVHG